MLKDVSRLRVHFETYLKSKQRGAVTIDFRGDVFKFLFRGKSQGAYVIKKISMGFLLVKANHLPRCVKGNLRNTKNIVGNFVTCTGGRYGGPVFRHMAQHGIEALI